jgi:phosphate acetyltransferase
MRSSLFVCGISQRSGSSVISLGLAGCFSHAVKRIGFFKPVGGGVNDPEVAVMRQALQLPHAPEDMCPVNIETAREWMSRGDTDRLLDTIAAAFARIHAESDFVIIEGINHKRALSAFDMSLNELISSHLDVPVLLVARDDSDCKDIDVSHVVHSVKTTRRSFLEKEVDVIGVVLNHLCADCADAVGARIEEELQASDIAVFGAVPVLSYLTYPKLDQIAAELDAEILIGHEALNIVVTKTIVAAMAPRHFITHVDTDRTLVIAPGDREAILMALACLQKAPNRRSISGVVLTGELTPAPEVLQLIRDLDLPQFVIMSVKYDTYQTATRIDDIDTRIRPQDRDKIDTARSAVMRHVRHEHLWQRLDLPRPRRRSGSSAFLEDLLERSAAAKRTIVLPEGDEPRTLNAVQRIVERDICPVILLGNRDRIAAVAELEGIKLDDRFQIVDPSIDPRIDEYVEKVVEYRKGRKGGITPEVARQWLDESPIHFGMVMVKTGAADGLVAGAVHSTADTIRPAFQIIRVKPEYGIASSVFFMALQDRVLVYGDCAIVPNPNADELAAIAIASARTTRAFGIEPRVAMLSYSTGSSGSGESVDKVAVATKLVKERNPNFAIDGPLQYDAAIDPDVGKLKQPDSPVAGQANVFIFPDLDAGNIAYKAVQRSANAIAVGPVMQGLNAPVNDLSRGCKVDDIVYTIAVTAIQASAS